MGGSGKTTLAKELFNRNFCSFQRCSFVSDVRDAASKNALPDKQKKLLKDLYFGDNYFSFDSIDEGKAILAKCLSSLQVLIVLDDVDHIDQVNALLPNKDNLRSQSIVIVTSRESAVLKSCCLSCIYKMPGLNSSPAKQLFCSHAFLQSFPPAGFETLTQKFVDISGGLPLSLKVLGGQLYGNDSIAYWETQLNKISRILPIDIRKCLQVSYNALDEEEKEMFLDVACFLIGKRKSTAIAMWDGSGWSGLHGLQSLVNKCLVELVNEQDYPGENMFYGEKIKMHDHLRDMGREIACEHSSYRLWSPEQIDKIKKHFKEGMPIRGIGPPATFVTFKKNMHQLMGISSRRFSNGLQILNLDKNELKEEFASLSEGLVWLRWEGFPLKILPPWLRLKHLSVLEFRDADKLEELWEDNADPPLQLRELIIWGEGKLQRLPSSIGYLRYLKNLYFRFGGSSLREEFCGLQSLEYLDFYSPKLSSLPAGFGNLISLKHINLEYSTQLRMLPESFSELIHLQDLHLNNCEMLYSLPDDFGNLISLKQIELRYCRRLSMLPVSFNQLIHLETLDLSHCKMLSPLPDCKMLSPHCSQLSTSPDSFNQLIHLKHLYFSGCPSLETSTSVASN